jgi:serine/threonine protein kinase
LKPGNVLIDDDGLVRITDFGIAVLSTATRRHTLAGTPGYMAPEQRATGTPLSERTDIYALGLVLYELLVGQHALKRAEGTGPPPRPSALVPDVNLQLERVVMQALSPDPRNRPSSALEMAAGLPQVDADGTGVATAPHGLRTGMSTSPWLVGVAIAAVVAIRRRLLFSFAECAPTHGADTIVVADFEKRPARPCSMERSKSPWRWRLNSRHF